MLINKAKICTEKHLDGKYLISISDDGPPSKDVIAGYKRPAVIERVFRDLKHLIGIRPVNHRLPERIQAHVLLCWLAILLIRMVENETRQIWSLIKKFFSK